MHEAGLSDAVGVVEADVEVGRVRSDIERSRHDLDQCLENLSFYTGEAYSGQGVELAPLPMSEGALPEFDPAQHPEVRFYDHEIAKKEAEISMTKRAMLPSISAYSRYSWYGSDPASFDDARADVRERGYSVGLSARLPLSEDFRSLYTVRRNESELSRLRAERVKKVAELEKLYHGVELKHEFLLRNIETRRAMLKQTEYELGLLSRLVAQQTVGREKMLEGNVALVAHVLECRRGVVERLLAVWSLRVLRAVIGGL